MSENSLKIRSRFVKKISNKLTKLNEDLELLGKVDRKIFRNKRVQSGGADVDVNAVQKDAIKKLLEIRKAQADIDTATAQATNLSKQIAQITVALSTIQDTVNKINITVPATLAAAKFDVSSLSKEVVDLLLEKGDALKWAEITDQANSGLANEDAFNALKNFLWPIAPGADVLSTEQLEAAPAPVEGAPAPVEGTPAPSEGTSAPGAPGDEGDKRKYRFW